MAGQQRSRVESNMQGGSLGKRASALGLVAGGLVLAMASNAFACTYFGGKLTVRAATVTGAPTAAFADGSRDGYHGYCPAPASVDNDNNGVSKFIYPEQAMAAAGSFTVEVGQTTTCLGDQNVSDGGLHDVKWFNRTETRTTETELVFRDSCFAYGEKIGEIQISSTGLAPAQVFAQKATAPGDEVAVCLDPNNAGAVSPPEVRVFML